MDVTNRIERALNDAIGRAEVPGCPPRLAAAMRYAVFPRGARVRPRLCHSVAAACGEDHPAATEAAGAALELLHCASLVHDDLPCFDAAETRRGRPSVHKAFGEPLAVLTGDALIVLAFQTLARLQCAPERLAPLTLTIAQSVGVPFGHRRGPGLGVRITDRSRALSSLQDRRIVRGGDRCRSCICRCRCRAVANGRRETRRGLSGRRRYPRRRFG